jgi:GDPmannose 4,6-dehydratase
MDRAMIIGHSGQDGTLLFERLEREGRQVLGMGRTGIRHNLQPGTGYDRPVDILDRAAVENTVRSFAADAIFYLAAYHHSAEDPAAADSADLYLRSHDIHVRGLLNVLEAAKRHVPRTRIFYAASSHCFGQPAGPLQDETTPLRPYSPYGITKTTGVQLCRMYREDSGVRASVGFLYNHESPLRKPNFLSSRIVRHAVAISRRRGGKLVLGDLSARVDWGYAPDYVDAMIRILQLDSADDFVIATKESHSVEEFVATAFSHLGIDWRRHVEVQPARVVKRVVELVGDNAKLRAATGWSPSISFQGMIRTLVDAELQRIENGNLTDREAL